jgi:hypothetical protein
MADLHAISCFLRLFRKKAGRAPSRNAQDYAYKAQKKEQLADGW